MIPEHELEFILAQTEGFWRDRRGTRFLLTGASGFVGGWLIDSLLWANARLNLGISATVIARDPKVLASARPHWIRHPQLQVFHANVVHDPLPAGTFDFTVHGATETNVRLDEPAPLLMFMTAITGTQRLLEVAARNPGGRFLLLSSGAVYGKQPPELMRVSENHLIAPDCAQLVQVYGHGKRAAEVLVNAYTAEQRLQGLSARCFAFLGAYLPLDSGFAAGNFMADMLAGRPITIRGDGTPLRSYLYGQDMTVWLWTLLFAGTAGKAYNVGSEESISIAELALAVQSIAADPLASPVRVMSPAEPGHPSERYIPDTTRARESLGLKQTIGLTEGLRRMAGWHNTRQNL